MITQAPRGTKDWFGRDIEIKNKIQEMAREIAASFNFTEISTPAFEHTQLFNRVGEDTDVVQKEMYTFEDKGGRSISLKPEGTSPVIRAYLEHNMYANAAPTKLFYFTQAFRYEKPASGRLRQHHQFGCELIGSKFPIAEFEVILIAKTLIERLGLKDMKLHINSIAEGECRENYKKALLSFLDGHSGKLCSTCRDRMKNNPLRVIDCKVEGCKEIIKDAPRIIEFLDDECQSHMQELENLLKTHNIDYVVDKDIVRGLDYYTKTVFEFIDKDGFTLCGGGRYDKLIKEIDGKNDIPAVGFGMGIERIIYFLEKEKIEIDIDTTPDIYIGNINNQDKAYELALNLRNQGIRVETDVMNRSLKAQMKYADKIRAKYSVVIGDDEVIKGEAVLKNMSSGEKTLVRLDEIGGN